ncbi:MAG: hypothetical protein M1294_02970 [Firmicutes bacterium]|jgi:hypothetical protein|nr:hypothetical protein [Bacillota bacterium]MCL5012437.1 hypothetical protein [Bacillota bacterium]
MKVLGISLLRLDEWIPGISQTLIEVNQALRNINRGKMDFLPYSKPIGSLEWYMEALLTPQGSNLPPAVGHWQIRIAQSENMPDIVLQGKSRAQDERGRLLFHCEGTHWQTLASKWPDTEDEF